MRNFARQIFPALIPGQDGLSDLETAQKYPDRTECKELLEAFASLPAELAGIWALFGEVSQGRSNSGMGASPLTWQCMQSWANFTGQSCSAFEWRALRVMDAEWCSAQAKSRETD